jgi:hypothetical protein
MKEHLLIEIYQMVRNLGRFKLDLVRLGLYENGVDRIVGTYGKWMDLMKEHQQQ